jgi:two-component system sensor histidine kinase BaeS
MERPGAPLPGIPPGSLEWRWALVKLVAALALSGAAAAWIARGFTDPLSRLAQGASAFQRGDLTHRIPETGPGEFADVAAAMNRMARQTADRIDQLEQDAMRRRKFLAETAHELRSPVATMRTMACALQEGVAADPQKQARATAALARTSDRMLRLVQDLMDVARLDLDDIQLTMTRVDVRELAAAAVHQHELDATANGMFIHPVPAGPPVEVFADADRIAQVLGNVLGNAVSHAGRGAEVRIRLEQDSEVRVSVSDSGRGIPAEALPYVFDPFYRADAARGRESDHCGLGLGIARRLAEVHGGALSVESAPGCGTTMTLTLPGLAGSGSEAASPGEGPRTAFEAARTPAGSDAAMPAAQVRREA